MSKTLPLACGLFALSLHPQAQDPAPAPSVGRSLPFAAPAQAQPPRVPQMV